MSLFLNCASAVIGIAAKAAYLLFTICGSMDHGLPHGFWHQYRPRSGLPVAVGPRAQTRPSDAAGIMDITMASGRSIDHRHSRGLRRQHGPQTSTQTQSQYDHGPKHGPLWQYCLGHHHSHGWQPRPLRSIWSPGASQVQTSPGTRVALQAAHINVAHSSCTTHGHQHKP